MKKLNIAVIGAGRLGGFHAEKIIGLPHVELVAVVDPVAGQPRPRGRRVQHRRPWPTRRSLLGQIDAAVIAAPTRLHHELALEFLQAGAHLLVEKPLCGHAGRGRRAGRGRPAATAACSRWATSSASIPALTAALPHLRGPRFIEAVRTSGFTFRSTDVGVVLDLMIHDIDLVLSLVGSPLVKVEAAGLSLLGGHEDVANARLEFECGCVATLSASRVSYEPVRRMHGLVVAGVCRHRLRHADHDAGAAQRNAAAAAVPRRSAYARAGRVLPRAPGRGAPAARAEAVSRRSTPWRWSCRISSMRFARRVSRA